MKSTQRQTMKLQQKLSPQQILLMQLVQMPVTALEQRIKEEIEKNPLLEDTPPDHETLESLPDTDHDDDDDRDDLISIDTDDDDYSYRERVERDKNADSMETVLVSEVSFFDALLGQLELKNLTDRQRAIAQEIIGSIDDAGYVSRSTDLIANDLLDEYIDKTSLGCLSHRAAARPCRHCCTQSTRVSFPTTPSCRAARRCHHLGDTGD